MAVLVAVVCLALLVRLLLGSQRRHRVDQAVLRWGHAGRRLALWCCRWPSNRKAKAQAAREAQEAIDRARSRGVWKDNVFTPESFRQARKKDRTRD